MPVGIRYDGTFTDHSGMRRVETGKPLAGAIRDWSFATLQDGVTPVTIPDLVGGHPLTVFGATGVVAPDRTWLRFDGVNDYAEAALGDIPQPYTRVIVFRCPVAPVNGSVISGNTVGGGSTIAVMEVSGLKFVAYGGTGSVVGPAANTTRHVIVASFNGASSGMRVDGVEYSGTGTLPLEDGLRVGANASLTAFTRIDIERLAILDHAADSAERAAIVAELT